MAQWTRTLGEVSFDEYRSFIENPVIMSILERQKDKTPRERGKAVQIHADIDQTISSPATQSAHHRRTNQLYDVFYGNKIITIDVNRLGAEWAILEHYQYEVMPMFNKETYERVKNNKLQTIEKWRDGTEILSYGTHADYYKLAPID